MSVILGETLSSEGPGVSDTAIFWPLMPREGINAMAKMRIPIPPIQCVKERQKTIPFGNASTSERIEEPVVEKPEQDSKNASAGLGMLPVATKGTAPRMPAISQHRLTMRNPSRTLSCFMWLLQVFVRTAPMSSADSIVQMNGI